MKFSVRILMIAAMALAYFMLNADASIFSSKTDQYCGVAPYPEPIPELPAGRADSRIVSVLNFIRHGDRSPAGPRTCWNSIAPQPFNFCTSNLESTPSVLTENHRDKSSAVTFPLRPIKDAGFYPGTCFIGQLSDKGHWMSFNNGHRVGKHYQNEWKNAGFEFTTADMQTRTTDVPRTKESAESFVTGMVDAIFGTENAQNIEVPIMGYTDVNTDPVRLGNNVCPPGVAYINEAYNSAEYKKYVADVLTPLENRLKPILGLNKVDVNVAFDCLKVHICQDLEVPRGITADLDKRITDHATHYWNFALLYDRDRASRYLTGPLLIEIYTHLLSLASHKSRFTEAPKFRLYSGHDHGPMMNLAAALRIQEVLKFWPPYSAMLNMEIADLAPKDAKESSLHIRIVYQAEVFNLPFCIGKLVAGGYCPIETVLAYLKPLLPTQEECPLMKTPDLDFLTNGKTIGIPANVALAMNDSIPSELHEFALPLLQLKHDFEQAESAHPTISHAERWSTAN